MSQPRMIDPTRTQLTTRQVVIQAAGVWVASRMLLAVLTYLSLTALSASSSATGIGLFASWNQWDTKWYIAIATSGYTDTTQTAFFPLFPLLIHIGTLFVGQQNAFLAGVLVANLSALVAFIGLGLLAADEFRTLDVSLGAMLAMAAYPFAFFLAAAYTESLFLVCAIFALLCARRGRWLPATALAFLAMLTRSDGLLLALPLGWEYIRQHLDWHALRAWFVAFRDIKHPQRIPGGMVRRRKAAALAVRDMLRPRQLLQLAGIVLAAPAAVGCYMVYLAVRFGQPLAFLTAQHANPAWARQVLPAWQTLAIAFTQLVLAPAGTWAQVQPVIDIAAVVFVVIIALVAIRTVPLSFTLYTLGVVAYAILAPSVGAVSVLMSARRVMLGAFPVFVALGRWMRRYPWLQIVVVGAGFAIQALVLTAFLTGQWSG